MSVFVNLIPQSGHFLFLLIVVSSIHLLQNRCGQVLSTTSRYLSPVQLHIILPLYSYSSILSNSFSALEFRLSRRVFSWRISDLSVYFSFWSFWSCLYFYAFSSLIFLIMISFSEISLLFSSTNFFWDSSQIW